MKSLLFLACAGCALAQAPIRPAAVVNPPGNSARLVVASIETRLNDRLATIGPATDRVYILGLIRGLYLEGYGSVYTAELDLIETPRPSPFRQKISPEEAVKVHQRKVANLALLKKSMRDMWLDASSALSGTPETEQVVLAVRLFYQPWEDTAGLPTQIVMKGPRKAAVTGTLTTEEQ
jgi:hypothetical protein